MPITLGSDAVRLAITAVNAQRIAVLTPYWPIADERVCQYFGQCGLDVRRIIGLKATSPINIAEQSADTLEQTLDDLNGDDVDAIVQVGTNLGMAKIAATTEQLLGKPIIAINTALYWHALRSMGIDRTIYNIGHLLERHEVTSIFLSLPLAISFGIAQQHIFLFKPYSSAPTHQIS